MIMEVLPDAGKVVDDVDPNGGEMVCGADPREHQDLGGADRPGTEDHFCRDMDDPIAASHYLRDRIVEALDGTIVKALR